MEVYPSSRRARAARPRRRRREVSVFVGALETDRGAGSLLGSRSGHLRGGRSRRCGRHRDASATSGGRGARGEAPRGEGRAAPTKATVEDMSMVVSVGCDARDDVVTRARVRRQRTDAGGYRAERFASWRAIRGRERPRGRRERGAASRARRDAHDDPPAARVTHLARRVLSGLEAPFPCAVSARTLSRRLVPVALRSPAGHPPARALTPPGTPAQHAARRLMVFGGTGMVGSAIAAEAVRRGLSVTCVTRGGAPPAHIASSEWGGAVRWLRGDALEPDTYRDAMRHHGAVVTSVGRLPLPSLTHEEVVRDNGETNIIPGRVARELGVPRLVVVGASIPAFVPGMAFGFSPSRGVFRAGHARRQGSRRGVRQGRIRGCRGYRKGCRGIRSGRLETGRRVRDATRGRRRPPARRITTRPRPRR